MLLLILLLVFFVVIAVDVAVVVTDIVIVVDVDVAVFATVVVVADVVFVATVVVVVLINVSVIVATIDVVIGMPVVATIVVVVNVAFIATAVLIIKTAGVVAAVIFVIIAVVVLVHFVAGNGGDVFLVANFALPLFLKLTRILMSSYTPVPDSVNVQSITLGIIKKTPTSLPPPPPPTNKINKNKKKNACNSLLLRPTPISFLYRIFNSLSRQFEKKRAIILKIDVHNFHVATVIVSGAWRMLKAINQVLCCVCVCVCVGSLGLFLYFKLSALHQISAFENLNVTNM